MARKSQREVIEELVGKINRKFDAIQPIVERMDEDYDSWRMKKFEPLQGEAVAPEDAYTSNMDRVVAEAIVSGIARAQIIIRAANEAQPEPGEDSNDNLERFCIGLLNLADERLKKRGELPLLQQAGWYASVRGRAVVLRSLLLKSTAGESVPDITPLDPRNVVWEMGENGPIWVAVRKWQSKASIRDQYPGFKFGEEDKADPYNDADSSSIVKYDYYWSENAPFLAEDGTRTADTYKTYWNCVICDGKYAKKPTHLFVGRFPIVIRATGSAPAIAPFSSSDDEFRTDDDYDETVKYAGDSVFALTRGITPIVNRLMSYNIHITALQADPAHTLSSWQGEAATEETPFTKGKQNPLSVANQEAIALLLPPEVGRAAAMLLEAAKDEHHAGGLSRQAVGEAPPGGMSGTALSELGAKLSEKTFPYLQSVESAVLGALEIQVEQFETGAFAPLRVYGKTFGREEFDQYIKAQDIQEHGTLRVRLKQDVPRDEQLNVMLAKMLIEPTQAGDQLSSVEYAREILDIQDQRLEQSRINLSRAKTSAPALMLMEQMESAVRRQDMQTAQYLQNRIQQLLMMEWLEQQALMFQFAQMQGGPGGLQSAAQGMGGQPPPPGGRMGGGNGAGPMPQMASRSDFQSTANQPSPVAGQNSGAPRPGAQTRGY